MEDILHGGGMKHEREQYREPVQTGIRPTKPFALPPRGARPLLGPEDTLCFAAPLGSSEVTIRAAARGANKHKTRPRAFGLALALAAEALGGAAVLAHWTTRQKDLGHGHFETLMAHVLEKWAACV